MLGDYCWGIIAGGSLPWRLGKPTGFAGATGAGIQRYHCWGSVLGGHCWGIIADGSLTWRPERPTGLTGATGAGIQEEHRTWDSRDGPGDGRDKNTQQLCDNKLAKIISVGCMQRVRGCSRNNPWLMIFCQTACAILCRAVCPICWRMCLPKCWRFYFVCQMIGRFVGRIVFSFWSMLWPNRFCLLPKLLAQSFPCFG